MIDDLELRKMINDLIQEIGSQKEAAKKIGCSESYLSDYRKGRREAGDKILNYFNLLRVFRYVRKN